MSEFFAEKFRTLVPYVPGEQPKERKYVKLNTNESPFSPSPKAIEYAAKAAQRAQLYPDPECTRLREKAAAYYGVENQNLFVGNGSDEVLDFAFAAFGQKGAVFADVTYGFYKVFAARNGVAYREIPLRADFTIDANDYVKTPETVFIANPNAPTGLVLSLGEIEEIVKSDLSRVVVVDEAYVDFGGESAVALAKRYPNLLVTQTFSKSRSLAGARLGFGIGNAALIADLNTLKYSLNPYNVNAMTQAAGEGALEDEAYTRANCAEVARVREKTKKALANLGFSGTDSMANFLFAKSDAIAGKDLYEALKARGILVRHFETERLRDYNRISVGSEEEMNTLLKAIETILEERK